MLGKFLKRIREERKITKKKLAKELKIDPGYLTHIEKAERKPSIKMLFDICDSLDVPYQNLLSVYDKQLDDEQEYYNYLNFKSENRILLIDDIKDLHYMKCPSGLNSVSFGLRISDDSMDKTFDKDTYVFVDLGAPLHFEDIGLFYYNGQILIRRLFIHHRKSLFLHADNPKYENIKIKENDNFYIIGKIMQ